MLGGKILHIFQSSSSFLNSKFNSGVSVCVAEERERHTTIDLIKRKIPSCFSLRPLPPYKMIASKAPLPHIPEVLVVRLSDFPFSFFFFSSAVCSDFTAISSADGLTFVGSAFLPTTVRHVGLPGTSYLATSLASSSNCQCIVNKIRPMQITFLFRTNPSYNILITSCQRIFFNGSH